MIALRAPFGFMGGGRPVLTYQPHYPGARDEPWQRPASTVESTVPGLVRVEPWSDSPAATHQLVYRCSGPSSRALRAQIRAFAEERLEASGTFWLPSFQHDFTVLAKVSGAWTIRRCGFAELYAADPLRYLIGYADATRLQTAYGVTGVTVVGDTEVITYHNNVAGDWLAFELMSAPEVLKLSHLRLARFTDEIRETWHTARIVDVELTAIEIPAELPAPVLP